MSKKKKIQTVNFTVYSVQPLPDILRASWHLPEYPFEKGPLGPAPDRTLSFFQSIGLIFYRDEKNEYGLMVQPKDNDPTPLRDRAGFEAYRSSGIMDGNLRIVQWSPGRDPVRYQKIVQKHGDAYAWQQWNKPVTVYKIDEGSVQIA